MSQIINWRERAFEIAARLERLRPTADLAALHRALGAAKIVCSLREDRAGKSYLRFSPHFYNTEAEMDRVIATLRAGLSL